ncbi:flagellar hook-basal body complex protein [bacterium NHP-B]|nr:flagellar hook-basal body complex protein [bacterium NHP-B]
MPTSPNEIVRSVPAFCTQGDASDISATGMDVYEEGVAHFAKHLANVETIGYMHDNLCHLTNGPHGETVRGVEMNNFDVSARGPMRHTERELDIGVRGRGFLLVDASGSADESADTLPCAKTTGSFQVDASGYVYDEGGNTLLGKKINNDGTVDPCSLMSDLDRVKMPMTFNQADATENVRFNGILPADNVSLGDTHESAVDVADSLGVGHQFRFTWTFLAPRVWQMTLQDSTNTPVFQDTAGGDSWVDGNNADGLFATRGGAVVHFTENGDYSGAVAATDANYVAWDDALRAYEAAKIVNDHATTLLDTNPTMTKADFDAQIAAFALNAYPAKTIAPSDTVEYTSSQDIVADLTGVAGTIGVGGPFVNVNAIKAAGTTDITGKQTTLGNTWNTLSPQFTPQSMPPKVFAQGWLNSEGVPVGSADSTIALDPSTMALSGNQYQLQTPEQDGRMAAPFKGISISDTGVISSEFFGQDPKPEWQLFLVNFPNNNAMEQHGRNLLLPTIECGDPYVLSTPLTSNLGATQAKSLVTSNVDDTKTMLGSQKMSMATQMNTTVFKIAVDLDKFIIGMISQTA